MNEKYKQNAIKLAELLGWNSLKCKERSCTYWFDSGHRYTIERLTKHFTSYNELFKILRSMPERWGYEATKYVVAVFKLPIDKIHYTVEKILLDEQYIYELQNACIYYLEHKNE